MKTFAIEVLTIVEVTLDEAKFTPEFMAEFNRTIFEVEDIEEHAARLGRLVADGTVDHLTTEHEGYGDLVDIGFSFKVVDVAVTSEAI